jgi:hypothetical protein
MTERAPAPDRTPEQIAAERYPAPEEDAAFLLAHRFRAAFVAGWREALLAAGVDYRAAIIETCIAAIKALPHSIGDSYYSTGRDDGLDDAMEALRALSRAEQEDGR